MTSGVVDRVATPAEHARLAAAVGWEDHFDDEVLAASLAASLAGVVYLDDAGCAIGMARAVGDGLQYAYVQDVIVHPDHAGEGIATELVARLLEVLRPASGIRLFVGLFASADAEGVYESLGFTSEGVRGMRRELTAQQPGA